ncbi:hypothetical protein [uncultured Thiodictyon sp.]|uniref:hypothetical protein n=1 Tax=uncultured Thiodictyon sp. TaxID=1846217 RepID=UPI0025EF453C|nr:hypothetical protein [uncultured Thiodictyon sp.]
MGRAAAPTAALVAAAVDAVDRDLGRVFHQLEEYNADFEALQTLEQQDAGTFSGEEQDELRRLLGQYG